MQEWLNKLNTDEIFKLVGLAGAFVAFMVALWQYRIAQKWKKSEFLANEYKNFINNDYVQKAFLFLDDYSINISYIDTDSTTKVFKYDKTKLASALQNSHDNPKNNRKYDNAADLTYIRLCIDKFLFKMGVFQTHLEGKLIEKKKLKPYLNYWIELLTSNTDHTIPTDTKKIIHYYIHDNKLISLINLFKTFDHQIENRK